LRYNSRAATPCYAPPELGRGSIKDTERMAFDLFGLAMSVIDVIHGRDIQGIACEKETWIDDANSRVRGGEIEIKRGLMTRIRG
jgi:hypothetical protein